VKEKQLKSWRRIAMSKTYGVGSFALIAAAIILVSATAWAERRMAPQVIEYAEKPLELKGGGDLYYAVFLHVYQAGLYGPQDVPAERLLEESVPKCLRIEYEVSLDRDQFVRVAEEVLRRQRDEETLAALRQRLDVFHAAYRPVAEGDEYMLCYTPERGTELILNGNVLTTVSGDDFAHAYFGIWLDENPISDGLRRALISSAVREPVDS
jgi:hypothetical protein